jgi:uroporphyrinogen III methyltransferase/synthase
MTGTVYLVGAGPGDPGLLTLRGRELLESCDAVVYDDLVNPVLLEFAPRSAERIPVGKRAGLLCLSQDFINGLLIDRAQSGMIVVRLKGGDPFLFGRGGEEAEALNAAGVPWEVVPGVSSALAVPAAAGIPVTHRRLASSVAIVTAHEHPGKSESRLRWEHLAKGADTLVFLMGFTNLEETAARLIDYGRPPDTPAAVIQWGTYSHQRVATGTLDDIARRVQEADLGPPAVLVVGEVVALAEQLGRPVYEALSCLS